MDFRKNIFYAWLGSSAWFYLIKKRGLKKFVRKGLFILGFFIIFLFTSCTAVFANGNSLQSNNSQIVENIIQNYFKLREDSFYVSNKSISQSTMKTLLEKCVLPNIISDENIRIKMLTEMADRMHIQLVAARTTAHTKELKTDGNILKAYVYEWTFFDYLGEKGLLDTAGFGVEHELIFQSQNGSEKLIADNYDESDLTGITSGTSMEGRSDVTNETESGPISADAKFAYSVSGCKDYADRWVYHLADNGNYESYYNPAYKNYNSVGGDCTNYVSQCMSEGGGLPKVGYNQNYSSDTVWWYNNQGTGYTSDDTASNTWARASAHRSFMMNTYGTVKDNPTDSDILPGNPVYYWNSGNWNHATICVGYNNNAKPIINSHNYDRWHVPWDYWQTTRSTVKVNSIGTKFSGSGRAITKNGAALSGVTMTFNRVSGSGNIPAAVTTDANGNWSQTGFVTGTTYRVTARRTGYAFYPISIQFSNSSTTLNFTGGLSTVTPLSVGRSVNGALIGSDGFSSVRGTGHYADRYSFSASANQQIVLAMTSAAFDTYLYLIGPNGSVLTSDDDSGNNSDSRIPGNSSYYTLPFTGTYIVEATSYNSGRTGSYILSLGSPNNFVASGWVTTGSTTTQAIAATKIKEENKRVVSGTAIPGVTLSFSRVSGTGKVPAAVVTNSIGGWSQTGFQSGTTYRVKPSKAGYIFNPAYFDFSNPRSVYFRGNSSVSFSGSGRVTTRSGAALSGVTMTFSRVSGSGNLPAAVTTDANGNWSQTGFVTGTTYRVTARRTGYAFYPISIKFSNSSTTLNFTGCLSSVTPLAVGQAVKGALTTGDGFSSARGTKCYADRYSFSASVNQQIALVMTSATFDTYLYLIGPDGSVLASDDDGGYGADCDSRIPGYSTGYYTLPSTGTYIVETTSYDIGRAGSYIVSLSSPNKFVASGWVTTGGTITQSIDSTERKVTKNKEAEGTVIPGVTMRFSRVSGTGTVPAAVVTNSLGGWSQTGFQSGTTYRVIPSKSGYIFNPVYLVFNNPGSMYFWGLT